jgi:hypothetical protein
MYSNRLVMEALSKLWPWLEEMTMHLVELEREMMTIGYYHQLQVHAMSISHTHVITNIEHIMHHYGDVIRRC